MDTTGTIYDFTPTAPAPDAKIPDPLPPLIPDYAGTGPVVPNPSSWTSEQIQANLLRNQQTVAWLKNASLKNNYLSIVFPNWLTSYNAGRADVAGAPKPPQGFLVQPTIDGWSSALVQIGPPVCDMPDFPRIPPPVSTLPVGVAHVGKHNFGMYWNAASDDTTENSAIVEATSEDGVKGRWQKVGLFGYTGWFAKVG